jgi:hypothetical protein
MVHVPYHGAAPELTDLIAGQVHVSFDPIQASIGYIKGGMLRPLAVTTATRSDALPNVPTVGEFVPGFEARTWQGLGARTGTPAEIKEVNGALADPRLKARFADLGITPMPMTPAECQKFITEAKFVFEKGCEQFIVGSGQMGNVHLSPEAEGYFAKKGCKVLLQPTPEAIRVFNKSHAKKIGLFHVTC